MLGCKKFSMTQLLPIALRGLLSENVRVPIVKLCAFLNAISQKVIDPESLTRLQKDVAQCLVSFELRGVGRCTGSPLFFSGGGS